jgi:hypothetical protein
LTADSTKDAKAAEPTTWDVFICHASEDKAFVRRLVSSLAALGVDCWFDEFELRIGDSLVAKIDEGLARSRHGIVVLSPSFFGKKWTVKELGGLVAKSDPESGGRILPIWHRVSVKDVVERSPTLADLRALDTGKESLEVIALRILQVVKPSAFETLRRIAKFDRLVHNAKSEIVPIDSLKLGPIRHQTLPPAVVVRVNLIHAALREVRDIELARSLDLFKREIQPHRDLEFWERLAAAYLVLTSSGKWTAARKRALYGVLLTVQLGGSREQILEQARALTSSMVQRAIRALVDVSKDPGAP